MTGVLLGFLAVLMAAGAAAGVRAVIICHDEGWSVARGAAIVFAVACVLLASLCFIAAAHAQSGAHGDGHAEGHDTYRHWHPPGNPGSSCCNNADCRPTRAFLADDGWHAWNGRSWLLVPADRVLPTDYAGDGRSHICEREGFIYCFTPGPPRS